jgi:hypothetical protein
MLGRLCADGSQSCNLHLVPSLSGQPLPFGIPASPHSLRQLPYSGPAEPCSAHLCRPLSGCDWSSFKPCFPSKEARYLSLRGSLTDWGRPQVCIGPGASTDSKPERITKMNQSTYFQRLPFTLSLHLFAVHFEGLFVDARVRQSCTLFFFYYASFLLARC